MAGVMMVFLMLILNVCWLASLIEANTYSFEVLLKENRQDLKWNESYANEKNEEFHKLVNKVRSKLGIMFYNVTDIIEITVNKFIEGSVYADFTVSLKNDTNTTKHYFSSVLNSTNSSLDIHSFQNPRAIEANLEITSFVWKDSYGIPSSCDYATVTKELKARLFDMYKSVPGLIDLVILGLKKTSDLKVNVQFKMLLDASSQVSVQDLEQILEEKKAGKPAAGNMQFGQVSMKEVTMTSNTGDEGKPSWVLLLVAFSCLAIFALIVYFVYRVIAQRFAQPKFKFGSND